MQQFRFKHQNGEGGSYGYSCFFTARHMPTHELPYGVGFPLILRSCTMTGTHATPLSPPPAPGSLDSHSISKKNLMRIGQGTGVKIAARFF